MGIPPVQQMAVVAKGLACSSTVSKGSKRIVFRLLKPVRFSPRGSAPHGRNADLSQQYVMLLGYCPPAVQWAPDARPP